MPKDLNKISTEVMDQIRNEKVKMRPRLYFVVGSILSFSGLVSAVIVSMFLVGLIRFSLRSHGPMAGYRLEQILSSFPWWASVLAVFGLMVGIWILRQYEFSFKINFKLLVTGFILAIIVGGFVIDLIGLNDVLFRRGPMRGVMQRYLGDDGVPREPGWRRNVPR